MHKLLERQLRRTLGSDPEAWTPEVRDLVAMVDAAYTAQDADRALIERSLDLSSQELSAKNLALARARDEADAANRSKSSFLANMSHEMRTPLNAVIGYSELLLEEAHDLTPEELVPELEKIRGAGKHLLGLINDVLDLSKIEAGRMDVRLESVDVRALADEVVTLLGGAAAKRGNTLALRVEGTPRRARADAGKLKQTLVNLVGNAAKFTEKGRIDIVVRRASPDEARAAGLATWGDAPAMVVDVRDTGIGIGVEAQAQLFTPFMQADASTSRRYGGTGLGLSLSRRFVQMMGGDITLRSVVGEGSTFSVWLGEIALAERPSLVAGEVPDTAPRTPVVLAVDDDPAAISVVTRFLSGHGYEVVGLTSGVNAVSEAARLRPHVVLLDVVMPEMDGWSVLTALKRDPRTVDIPVIMTSMSAEQELGFTLGAAEYLVKPLDWERLATVVRSYGGDVLSGDALVVDDEAAAREIHRRSLSRAGWTVREAADGAAALAAVREKRPAVVVLDLTMPGMDGFAFLEALHAEPSLRDVPVVVVSGRELDARESGFLQQHVARVLQKGSYDRSGLLRAVTRAIAARSGREEA